MKVSVLDQITFSVDLTICSEEWKNHKIGEISDVKGSGIYRFIEAKRDENGQLCYVHENENDNPIVIVGIVAYWLKYRTSTNCRLALIGEETKEKITIKEQFDRYTAERFRQFQQRHREDPRTWNWDWDYEFYCKYIIPHEMKLNRQTEALFDFVTEADVQLIQAVMDSYIEYLKHHRKELGYSISQELLVLRYAASEDDYQTEDLDHSQVLTVLKKLKEQNKVKFATIEGDDYEDLKLLPAGKAELIELEEESRIKNNVQEKRDGSYEPKAENDEKIVRELALRCFTSVDDARDFLNQIKNIPDREKPAIAKLFQKEGKLFERSMRRTLHSILIMHGLYKSTEDNWNKKLKKL